MSVGNQTSVAQVNNTLSALAVQLRELMSQIHDQWAYLNKIGATGLENLGGAGNGFSSADAATVLQMINYMSTVAGCYYGTVQQGGSGGTGAIDFNFEDALTPLWAGQ
jgi:hypothetical protein